MAGEPNPALATRRRVLELAETQRFVHHVADLDTGEVVSTELERPVTPISRAARLSRFGPVFDPTIFGHPIYRLGARTPYQATPEGWIELTRPTMTAPAVDTVYWDLPRDYDFRADFAGMFLTFTEMPTARTLASFTLSGHAFSGTTGTLTFSMQLIPNPVSIPVDANFGHHTVDLTFVPPQRLMYITMALTANIELLAFSGMTLGTAPLVLEPGVFA
jgi:hypothetical protein